MPAKTAVTAILVAESFANHLKPITPATPLPLVQICNTPVIDYHLENLIRNRIEEVHVIAYSSFEAVKDHLEGTKISTRKTWLESKEIKVNLVQGTENVNSLYGALQDLKHKNMIPSSFILLTIDTIAPISNLRELLDRHVARSADIPRQVMTAVFSEGGSLLRKTLAASSFDLENKFSDARTSAAAANANANINKFANNMPPETPMTALSVNSFRLDECDPGDRLPGRPFAHHFTVGYDVNTQAIKVFKKWEEPQEEGEAMPQIPIKPSKKVRMAIRTDLEATGVYLCAGEMTDVFQQFMPDPFELIEDTLANEEVTQNVCCVEVLPASTPIVNVNSVEAFLKANLDGIARFLFPMTRESNFGEKNSFYPTAQRYGPSVYIHTKNNEIRNGGRSSVYSAKLGPRCIIGPDCDATPSCVIRDSVIGRNVRLGKNVEIVGCVLMDDIAIADGCTLRNSVVMKGAKVGCNVSVSSNCVIGSRVKVDSTRPFIVPTGSRIVNVGAARDASLVGDKGEGSAMSLDEEASPYKKSVITRTRDLFESDPTPGEDNDELQDPDVEFANFIRREVITAIQSPSQMQDIVRGMAHGRIEFAKQNGNLVRAVVQNVIAYISDRAHEQELSVKDAYKLLKKTLNQFLHPLFIEYTKEEDEMIELLNGICLGLRHLPPGAALNPLEKRAEHILAYFFLTGDEDVAEDQGYVVISEEAIRRQDEDCQRLMEDDVSIDEDEQEICDAWVEFFAPYVARMDEDDDEDE